MEFIKDITKADMSVCEEAASFLQSRMWGQFKSEFGWKAEAFLIDWGQEKKPLLVLSRILFRCFSFSYVPWGPEAPLFFPNDLKALVSAEIAKKLKSFLSNNSLFIRFEPPWFNSENNEEENNYFFKAGFMKAGADVQAPDTVILNLKSSCKEILASMKPKWRYNISLSEKKGVTVNIGVIHELDVFYSLLKETAERDGIAVHSFEYYKALFEICGEKKEKINLYIAKHEGDVLAAIIVLFREKTATYLYGASSNNKRNLMAPYALQWKAVQDAKDADCEYYDFFGIPPYDDPNHPMAGLYRFKTGFGGQIIHRPGSWDYVYKPFFYTFFNIAERLRKKIRDLKKRK